MTRHLIPAALAFCTAMTCTAAVAATPQSVGGDNREVNVRVRYTEAETRSPVGSRAVALRVRKAADRVCGGDNPLLRPTPRFQRCRDATIDRVVRTLDAAPVAEALGRATGVSAVAVR